MGRIQHPAHQPQPPFSVKPGKMIGTLLSLRRLSSINPALFVPLHKIGHLPGFTGYQSIWPGPDKLTPPLIILNTEQSFEVTEEICSIRKTVKATAWIEPLYQIQLPSGRISLGAKTVRVP
jgi:hypothetical protein